MCTLLMYTATPLNAFWAVIWEPLRVPILVSEDVDDRVRWFARHNNLIGKPVLTGSTDGRAFTQGIVVGLAGALHIAGGRRAVHPYTWYANSPSLLRYSIHLPFRLPQICWYSW